MTAAAPLLNPDLARGFTIETSTGDPALDRARILLVGPPMSGKSRLLGSWNESTNTPGQPGLFALVAPDENTRELRSLEPKVPFVVVENRTQLEGRIMPWIMNGNLAKEFPSVETIGLDSISMMAKMIELEANDWQLFASRMSNLVSQLTRVTNPKAGFPKTYNLVVTCHEKDKYTTRSTGQTRERHLVGIEPGIAGQMAAMLPAYFDLVLYAQRVVEQYQPAPNTPFQQRTNWKCLASEPPDRKAPAGGKLWGKVLSGELDGTYAGLRTLCSPPVQSNNENPS
jgi:hypothetical protein